MPCILRPQCCLKQNRHHNLEKRVRFKSRPTYHNYTPQSPYFSPGPNTGVSLASSMQMNSPMFNSNYLLPTPPQPSQGLPATQVTTRCTPATVYTPLPQRQPHQYAWAGPNGIHTFTPAAQPSLSLTGHSPAFVPTGLPQTFTTFSPAPQAFTSFSPVPQAISTFTPAPQTFTTTFSPAPVSFSTFAPAATSVTTFTPAPAFSPLPPPMLTSYTPITSYAPTLLAAPPPMCLQPQINSTLSSTSASIEWDMISPYTSAKLKPHVACATGTSSIDLYTPAFNPPELMGNISLSIPNLEHMRTLWGDILVRPSPTSTTITITDVLSSIFSYLHTPISSEHESYIESRTPGILDKGFNRRMSRSPNPASFESQRGYVRVDALGGWTRFVGLRPAECRGGRYYMDIDSGC